MKIGDRISTPHGMGEIVLVERYSRIHGGMKRYGVVLDVNPFSYSPVCYFHDELLAHAKRLKHIPPIRVDFCLSWSTTGSIAFSYKGKSVRLYDEDIISSSVPLNQMKAGQSYQITVAGQWAMALSQDDSPAN